MGKQQRRKGADFERDFVSLLRSLDPTARRNLDQYQERSGKDIRTYLPFTFQLKCGAKPNIWRAFKEAQDAQEDGKFPVAIIRRDRKNTVAVMAADDWLDLVREWWELKEIG